MKIEIEPDAPAYGEMYINSMTGDVKMDEGMTIRTQIAAMAMQGIVSNQGLIDVMDKDAAGGWIAPRSVALADALIAELNK